MSAYDETFAKHITADANFDMMFGADEDNELMSTVLGEAFDVDEVDDKTCTCGVEDKNGGMKEYDPTDFESKGAEAPKDDTSDVSPLGKTDTYKQPEVIKAGDGTSADPESINDESEKLKGPKEFEYKREDTDFTSMLEEEIKEDELRDEVNFNGVEDKNGGMKEYDPSKDESKGAAAPKDDTSDVSPLGKTDTVEQKNVIDDKADTQKCLDCPEHIEDGIEKFKGEKEFEYKREAYDNFEQAYNELMLELGIDPDQPIAGQVEDEPPAAAEEPAETQSDDMVDIAAATSEAPAAPSTADTKPVDVPAEPEAPAAVEVEVPPAGEVAPPPENYTDAMEEEEPAAQEAPEEPASEGPTPEELAADEDSSEEDMYENFTDVLENDNTGGDPETNASTANKEPEEQKEEEPAPTTESSVEIDRLLSEGLFFYSKEEKKRKNFTEELDEFISNFLLNNGIECQVGGFYIGGNNSKFIKGQSNSWLTLIKLNSSYQFSTNYFGNNGITRTRIEPSAAETNSLLKSIASVKENLKSAIEAEFSCEVASINISKGRMGVTNLETKFKTLPQRIIENYTESSVDDLFYTVLGEATPKELEKLDDEISGEDEAIDDVDKNNTPSPYSTSELNEDPDDELMAAVIGR